MSKQPHWKWSLLILAALALYFLATTGGPDTAAAQPISSAPDLAQIWQQAQASGSYRFTAVVEQTLRPRPIISMIGQNSEQIRLHIAGEVQLPGEAHLRLSSEDDYLIAPILLIQRDGQTFVEVDGQLQAVENPMGANALPGNDYLSYLAAAVNARQLESQIVAGESFSRYAFDIDGPALATHMQRQMQAGLPANQRAVMAPLAQAMSGQGELWVDAAGLPRRQIIDLAIPGATAEYDSFSHTVVDFAAFGQLEPLPQPVQNSLTGAWTLSAPQAEISSAGRLWSTVQQQVTLTIRLIVLFILVLAATLLLVHWYQRRRRQFYAFTAGAITLVLLFTPVLQVVGYQRAVQRAAAAAPLGLAEAMRLADLPAGLTEPLADVRTMYPSDHALSPLLLSGGVSNPTPSGPACGDGSENPDLDSDGDGLPDYAEYCLGTDPFNPDTSGDGILDGVKVGGFEYNGRWWPMDPFRTDSNGDGMVDFLELPAEYGGVAPEMDSSGNGIPNLWDPDNDGDGVPDYLDFSPFSHTGVETSFDLTIGGGSGNSHFYVDIQIRPEDAEQLRYTTTALDWPRNDSGTMRDLTGSNEDLHLIPMLLIQTNVAPDPALARNYGVTILPNNSSRLSGDQLIRETDLEYPYLLYSPLLPVSDEGQIVAYQSRIAYPPAADADIRWQVELAWMVEGHVDSIGQFGRVTTEAVPLAVYRRQPFFITGMEVTKSAAYESAIFSISPDHPDNPANTDQQLYQTLFALNAAFLNAQQPEPQPGRDNEPTALREFKYRFDNRNLDNLIRFGLNTDTAVASSVQTFSHQDAALAATVTGGGRITQFLNQHYPQSSNATLVFAYEETSGAISLDDMPRPAGSAAPALRDASQLTINLDRDIPLVTRRGVHLGLLSRQGAAWSSRELGDMLAILAARYADVDEALANLSQSPELTADTVHSVIQMFYISWFVPQTTIVAFDGLNVLPAYRANQEIVDNIASSRSDLPTYLIETAELNQPGGGLKISSGESDNWGYAHAHTEQLNTYVGLSLATTGVLEKSLLSSDLEYAKEVVNKTRKVGTKVKDIYKLLKAADQLQSANQVSKWKYVAPAKQQKFGLAGLAAETAVIWATFGLTTDFSNPLAVKTAVTLAIVQTAFAIAFFVLGLNPVGAVLLLLWAIIDLIVFLVTGDSLMDAAQKAVAEFFYKARMLSRVESFQFDDGQTAIVPATLGGSEGLIAGNRLAIRDEFAGVISGTGSGRNRSQAYARYLATSDDAIATNQNDIGGQPYLNIGNAQIINAKNFTTACSDDGFLKTCRNQVGATFTFTEARLGAALYLQAEIFTRLRYEECGLQGSICSTGSLYDVVKSPKTLDLEDAIVVDVLPATVQELWAWDLTPWYAGHIFNPILNTAAQPAPDRFPTAVDSDSDGLLDNEELIHLTGADELAGGWAVLLPGDLTAWVSANPFQADTSGDGLSDKAKRESGLSPHAIHHGPRLLLTAEPATMAENGRPGLYVRPNDPVSFSLSLFNSGTTPISDVLSVCLPAQLADISAGAMSGDRQPPFTQDQCGPGSDGHEFNWDFSQNHLLVGQQVQTTFTATVGAAQSTTMTAEARVPYQHGGEAQIAIGAVQIYVDNDNPTISWNAPASGAVIGGGLTAYVLGGLVTDPTSWITGVNLSLPGAVAAELGSGSENGLWAYTWDLPADGVYNLTATAVDYFNRSSSAGIQVTVDNTPPQVAVTAPTANTTVSGSGGETITIPVQGTANDNLSGMRMVQISVNDQPWRALSVNNGQWQFDWRLPNDASAQGEHNLRVRALDVAGNLSDLVSRTIVVDLLPPTSELSDRTFLVNFPSYPTGAAITLQGVANDAGNAPLPAAPAPLAGPLHGLRDATIWLEPSALADSDGGLAVAWLGDFNGDRLADLVIGLPAAAGGAGRITVVNGRAGGWPTPPDTQALANSNSSFIGAPGAGLGLAIATVGDVNGDGFADLLVGDTANGQAYLIPGRVGPYGRDVQLDGSCPGCSRLQLPDGYALAGVSAAGDVNGDGRADYFVITQSAAARQAHLILGESRPATTLDPVVLAAVVVNLPAGSVHITGVGDRDGDQYGDFVVQTAADQLTVYHGAPLSAGARLAASALNPGTINAAANHLTTLGDSSGNGLADFAYGSGSSVTVVRGAADRSVTDTGTINLSGSLAFLAGAGDVTGSSRSDILVGAGGDAFLYEGGNLNVPVATLTGVSQAASAPYSAGADFNADGSADLLLVPNAATAGELGFGEPQPVDQSALPVSSGGGAPAGGAPATHAATLLAAANRHVSANGDCDGYDPCYFTIVLALAAAANGETIAVHPGVYAGFTINNLQNLTVSGVDADAVFVDGSGGVAARIQNSSGIVLSHMTLTNAGNGVELTEAGVGGYSNATLKITLERLFIREFSGHALFMDRVSTASFRRSTIAGSNSGAYIAVDTNAAPDPAFTPAWAATTPAVPNGTSSGGGLLAGPGNDLYAVRGGGTSTISRLTPDGSSLTTFNAPAPINAQSGVVSDKSGQLWELTHRNDSSNGPVHAIAVISPDEIYIGGQFSQIGGVTLSPPNIARWNGSQWQSLGGNWGSNKIVYSLEWDAPRQRLYAGLSYEDSGGGSGGASVRYWTKATASWMNVLGATTGVVYENVYALALNSAGSKLYAGGDLGFAEGMNARFNGIAFYEFATGEWRPVDGRPSDTSISFTGFASQALGQPWSFSEEGGGVWYLAPLASQGGPAGCAQSTSGFPLTTQRTRQCRLPGVVYDIVVQGPLIYIGGQFAYVSGGGTGSNAATVLDITGYGVARYREDLTVGGACFIGVSCWTTYGRPSFDPNDFTRHNGQARGAGEHPDYRPSHSDYWTDLNKGTNSNPVYALAWAPNNCSGCNGGGALVFGGDFTIYNWQDANGDNRVNDAIGSSELIPISTNVALTSWASELATPSPVASGPVRSLDVWNVNTHFNRILAGGDFPGHAAYAIYLTQSASPPVIAFWTTLDVPQALSGSNASIRTIGKYIDPNNETNSLFYFGGSFNSPYSGGSSNVAAWPWVLVNSTNRWNRVFDRRFYSITSSGSATLRSLPTAFTHLDTATVLVSNDATTNPTIYAIPGGSRNLWRYNSQTAAWDTLALLPFGSNTGAGAAAVWANGSVYLLRGGGSRELWRYDPAASTWTARAAAPFDISAGASLAWDGGNHLYVLPGGSGRQFLRYRIAENSWQTLGDGQTNTPDDYDAPLAIQAGAGLEVRNNHLYLLGGSGSTALHRFGPLDALDAPTPDKLVLDQLVYINAGGAATWRSPATVLPDFNIADNGSSVWVGGNWTPAPANAPITLGAASFLNPSLGIYRQTAATPFTAGYHTYTPDVTVSTDGCGGDCYTTIQNAMVSGANNVFVLPGQYPQNLYLVSGVNVTGSGAEVTVVTPANHPDGSSMVTARSVRGASFSGFTISGDNARHGLWVSEGARGIRFARNIVRDTNEGVVVVGTDTSLELVNNNLVRNWLAVDAGDCPSLNIRNNILAFNSNSGLHYSVGENCSSGALVNKYNLYWQNGADQEGFFPVGPGEIFVDPLFLDLMANDFRTQPNSPVINAGDPGDPAPPGSGRVDIGYLQQGAAGLYVSPTYCPTCANDGLTFGVNAFTAIQPALNAAETHIHLIAAAMSDPSLTVAAGPGVYTESISLPSYVNLVGSSAEHTIIDAGGSGSAATFDGVVEAGISGFTIRGASGSGNAGVLVKGAANHITLYRNLIRSNSGGAYGVRFEGRASGQVLFNTIVANDGGNLVSDGARTWAMVGNNILAQSATGLRTQNDGRIFNSFNLLYNTANYQDAANTGLAAVSEDIVGLDPLLSSDGLYRPAAASPAVDTADPQADVPTGGGDRADIGYFELRAIPLAIFLGAEGVSKAVANAGVESVEVAVIHVADPTSAITETLPTAGQWLNASLTSPGQTVSQWQQSFTPAQPGLYRIYSRATDQVGNVEEDPERWFNGAFLADNAAPVVSWEPTPTGGNAPFELRVLVDDMVAGFFNVAEVYFEVNGKRVNAVWLSVFEDNNRDGRIFHAWIAADDGPVTVQAFAIDRAGHTGQSGPVDITVTGQNPADTTPPSLTVDAPAAGLLAGGGQVVFSGAVSDPATDSGQAGSGVAAVEISVDGGYRWQPAQVDGNDWQFVWEAPAELESVSFPVRIRARDNAGNQAGDARVITVDNRPAELVDLTFSPEPDTYAFGANNLLTVSWTAVRNGSGPAEVFVVVDDQEETAAFTPDNLVSDNSFSVMLPAGVSYVHLTTQDQAGNIWQAHFGPWRIDRVEVDGYLDEGNGEWQGAVHMLDDDERGLDSPAGQTQRLYTRWDDDNFYLGWQGAYWEIDGSMWVYLSTGGPGSTTAVDGQTLPFAADTAVFVTNPATRYQFSGGNWQETPLDNADYARGESGTTEIHLPFGSGNANSVRLLAFAVDDDGRPWAVFPTDNRLDGPWSSQYHWPNLADATDAPNEGQPKGYSVDLALTSPQAPTADWGPGDTLQYEIKVTNGEAATTLSGLALNFSASDGLTHQGSSVIILDDLAPGQSQTVLLTGQVDSAITSIEQVTTAAALTLDGQLLQEASLSHGVDSEPPIVAVFFNPGHALATGLQSFRGLAGDGDGSGVALVEVSGDGVNWQPATGTQAWSADLTVPAGTSFDLYVRAVDLRGNMSEATAVTFVVDSTPPDVTFSLPGSTTAPFLNVTGTAVDPFPADGRVVRVEVQVDGGAWQAVSGPFEADAAGNQHWLFSWNVPYADGDTYQLRARATDAAGNIGQPTEGQSILVDRVAPTLAATQLITETSLGLYRAGNVTGPPILEGTAADGGGLSQVLVMVRPPGGDAYTEVADLTLAPDGQSASWRYTPTLLSILGEHWLTVTAVDVNGNELPARDQPTFILLGLNSPPEASDDAFETDEKTSLFDLDLLANDSDPDGDELNIVAVGAAEHGLAALVGDQVNYDPNGQFDWLGTGMTASDVFTYTITDGNGEFDTATVTITITGVNDAPVISDAPAPQTVQYSDGIEPVTLTAVDVDATEALTATAVLSGPAGTFAVLLDPPAGEVGLQLSAATCAGEWPAPVVCAWELSGAARLPAGVYDLVFTAGDGEEQSSLTYAGWLTVTAEDARPIYDSDNPISVAVVAPGGTAESFTLFLDVKEIAAEPDSVRPFPGDINLARVSVTMEPVGPGPGVTVTCSSEGSVAAYDYDARLRVRCDFPATLNLGVNVYTVLTAVGGDYYQGATEDVLVIYDPSLGFATGGGWYYWPGTEDPDTGYLGDKTNFGFTMSYNKNGKNVKGNLLLIRHLPDDTIYRIKSNALNGLALGKTNNPPMGWASISGKTTYLQPGWEQPEGNYSFILYVEDHSNGTDRVWLEVRDKNGIIVPDLSMPSPATQNAVPIGGGNIAVPH